jgi:hypothetical protein
MQDMFGTKMQNHRSEFDIGKWKAWFAWRPVHLYGTTRFAWLRTVSKRPVLGGQRHLKMEYTDSPSEFPAGHGLRDSD